MQSSKCVFARIAASSSSRMAAPESKRADQFNRTYEDGKCHVTAINHCTDEHSVVKLTPVKNFTSVKTSKMYPLPNEAVEGLKTALFDCKKAGKVIQHEADQLTEKLNQRRFPASPAEVQAMRKKILAKLNVDEESAFNLGPEHFSNKVQEAQQKYLHREVHKKLKKTRYNWKPLEFKTKEDGACFALSRLAPYYAEVRKVLNEFQRVGFKPKTILDYGSGTGSAFWACRDIWPEGVEEYCLVDPSDCISQVAMDVMRGSGENENSALVSKNVYFRRALQPSPENKYDLIIVHRTLIEIGSHEQRLDLISTLWSRTNKYLVIIEADLEDSFEAVMQARNFILTNGVSMDMSTLKEVLISQGVYTDEMEQILKNKIMSQSEKFLLLKEMMPEPDKIPTFLETGHVFAPCPHDGGCPLLDLAPGKRSCKFFAKWNEIRADGKSKLRRNDGAATTAFSYCIMKKGMRDQTQVSAGRLLDRSKSSGLVNLKVCTPFDGVQRFPVSKRAGPLYQLAKAAVSGQLFPLETDIVASDGDYQIVRDMMKEQVPQNK